MVKSVIFQNMFKIITKTSKIVTRWPFKNITASGIIIFLA